MKVSIVVPLHNEALNAELLYRELREFADEEKRIAEMIFVDDGSTDDTYERLVRACAGDPRVTVLRLAAEFRADGGALGRVRHRHRRRDLPDGRRPAERSARYPAAAREN